MAKRNKKTGHAAGPLAGLITADLLADVLGNVVGQFLADGSEKFFGKASQGKEKKAARREDVGLKILSLVGERGSIRIPKLARRMKTPLLPLLKALGQLREFGLIELDDRQAVRLTELGFDTLTSLREDAEEAAKELEKDLRTT